MKKDPDFFLEHILECILEIEKNVKGKTKVKFMSSIPVQDAVIRRLEIIGEASKNLTIAFKHKHPTIPWREIAGTRDILIHEYFGVDIDLVWKIVKKDLPDLKKEITILLKK